MVRLVEHPVITADDLLPRLRWVMEPSVSRDGEALAYVVSGPDRATDSLGYELFAGPTHGPDPLALDGRKPQWSPEGSRLAFLRRVDDHWRLVVREPNGRLTNLPQPQGSVSAFDWDPSGSRIVASVSAGRRSLSSLWVLGLNGDMSRLDCTQTANASAPRWSPDGERILFLSDQGVDSKVSNAVGIICTTVTGARDHSLVGPTTPITTAAWSPDGRLVAYIASASDAVASAPLELWVVDVAGGTRRRLGVGLDRSVGLAVRGDDERGLGSPTISWGGGGSHVQTIVTDGGRSFLARFGLDGGWDTIITGNRCILEHSASWDGSVIAFSWSDSVTPGEVNVVHQETGDEWPASHAGDALRVETGFSPTTRVRTLASDGIEVEGWLTLPQRAPERPPLVVQVHGGPHYPVGSRFSFDAQRLASRGLAVLRVNPRGAVGYGADFAAGNLGDWGGRDFADLMELIDQIVADGEVDGEGLGIIGESYGGYMATWAISQTSRFKAAVAENPITDLRLAAAGPDGVTFWHSELGGRPEERPEFYRGRSPISWVAEMRTALLLIHCEGDEVSTIAHSEALFDALRTLDREVSFVRIPGESHFFNLFGRLSSRIHRTNLIDEFLVSRLRPDAPGTTQRSDSR